MFRRKIRTLGAILAALLPFASIPAPAQDKPLKKVRIAVGTGILNVGYPMLTLARTLGYWKDEGYDIELMPVGASLQAIQQMVGGNAEFAEVNASVIVQGNIKNNLPIRIVMANGVLDWAVAVQADGPVRSASMRASSGEPEHCSPWWVWRASRANIRANCQEACNSGSASAARSFMTLRFC